MIQPIDCELHDSLEVACLYRYKMLVTLVSGTTLRGYAVTTTTQPDKTEMLVLRTEAGDQNVPMHLLRSIEIETKGAKFKSLAFPGMTQASGGSSEIM